MESKLTLRLNKKVVEGAKRFSKKNNTSISKIVENYLDSILKTGQDQNISISPGVEKISGILKEADIKDYKKEISAYIEKKHSGKK